MMYCIPGSESFRPRPGRYRVFWRDLAAGPALLGNRGAPLKVWIGLFLAIPFTLCAAERDTAEWAIRQGGRVMVNGNRTAVRNLWDLPAGELRITGIDLTGTLIDPKDLERIAGLED